MIAQRINVCLARAYSSAMKIDTMKLIAFFGNLTAFGEPLRSIRTPADPKLQRGTGTAFESLVEAITEFAAFVKAPTARA